MFSVSIGEILIIALVTILVIPPKDVPKFTTEMLKFFYKTKAYIENLKQSIEEDIIGIDNIKGFNSFGTNFKSELKDIKTTVFDISSEINNIVSDAERELAQIRAESFIDCKDKEDTIL